MKKIFFLLCCAFLIFSAEVRAVPDSRVPEEWLDRSHQDWQAANLLFENQISYGNVCFHAHQSAEKWLKGESYRAGLEPERSHDLLSLARKLVRKNPGIHDKINGAALRSLDEIYVSSRYPKSGVADLNKADAEKCLNAARRIHET